MPDLKIIGNRMRVLRKKAGITQGEAGERIGVSRALYAYWEDGTKRINIEYLLKFCEIVSAKPALLLLEENETLLAGSDCFMWDGDVLHH